MSTVCPSPDHWMTARDLATLAIRTIKDFPEYYHYYSEMDYEFNNIKQGNRNPLLYKDVGADGLKTGHTEEAGYSLTASVKRDDRRIILVLGGLPTMKARAQESERLIEWAFREFNDYKLFAAGDKVEDAEVWLGAEPKVPLTVAKDLVVTLPRKSRKDMKVTVDYDRPIPAPIKKGQTVGKLVVTAPDAPPVEAPLVAARERRRAWTPSAASRPWRAIWSGAAGTDVARWPAAGSSRSKAARAPASRRRSDLLVAALERGGIAGAGDARAGRLARRRGDPRLLLEGDGERWDAVSEALLLVAARRDHVTRVIAAGARRKASGSSPTASPIRRWPIRATAAAWRSTDLATLHRFALGDFAPDLTLILDLPVEDRARPRRPRARRRRPVRAPRPRLPRAAAPGLPRRSPPTDPARCVVIDASADPQTRAPRRARCGRAALGRDGLTPLARGCESLR